MQSSNQVSRSSSSRQGAVALVEFAIVLVPLLLLSFGAMSVSELVRVQQSIDRVAAEAARAAIAARPLVNTNQSSVRAAATVLATTRMRRLLNEAGLSISNASISLAGDFSRGGAGAEAAIVTVRVTYRHQLSPTSRAFLRAIYPSGVAVLTGVAYERMPRFASPPPK